MWPELDLEVQQFKAIFAFEIKKHFRNNIFLLLLNRVLNLGNLSKTTWRIFSVKGGGVYPPFPLRVFGQDDFPLRGEGVPPFPLRKIPLKSRYFRSKNSIFVSFFIHL